MDRNSFIFYRSFFDATKPLNEKQKAELFNSICEYALNQNETSLDPIVKAMFSLIKPQLEANHNRFVNGKKGGRPKIKQKPNQNQTKTKPKPNKNVNDNVNDNVIKDTLQKFNFSDSFFKVWKDWKKHKQISFDFKYKNKMAETGALKKLYKLAEGKEAQAIEILELSMANNWNGFFKLEK